MRTLFLLAFCVTVCFAQAPAVGDLIRKLGDDDFDVRQTAARALVELGEQARPAVEAARKDSSDAEVRRACAGILEEIDAIAVRQRLLALTKHPEPPPVPKFDPARLKPLVTKGGVLAKDERWTADRSYHITDTLRVAEGVKLTIEPGVVVLFDEKTRLEVAREGSLTVASGKDTPPTVFTSAGEKDGRPRPWGGLLLFGVVGMTHAEVRHSEGICLEGSPSHGSKLDRVSVYHTRGCGLTFNRYNDCKVSDCVVQDASDAGVLISNARATVSRCRIALCQTGVEVQAGSPTLEGLVITDIRGDGIRIRGGGAVRDTSIVRAERGVVLSMCTQVDDVRVAAIRGNGFQVERGGFPRLLDISCVEIGGAGLFVQTSGSTNLGRSLFLDCKGGDCVKAAGARINREGDVEGPDDP
jgi:hypothetical protein